VKHGYTIVLAISFVLAVPRSSSATLQIFGVAPDGNIVAASDSGTCKWDGSFTRQSVKIRSLGNSGVFLTAGVTGVTSTDFLTRKTTTIDFRQIVEDWAAKHPQTEVDKARQPIRELIENSLAMLVKNSNLDNMQDGTLLIVQLAGFVNRDPMFIHMEFRYHHPSMQLDQKESWQYVFKPTKAKCEGECAAVREVSDPSDGHSLLVFKREYQKTEKQMNTTADEIEAWRVLFEASGSPEGFRFIKKHPDSPDIGSPTGRAPAPCIYPPYIFAVVDPSNRVTWKTFVGTPFSKDQLKLAP
jgi:hypothetical protein